MSEPPARSGAVTRGEVARGAGLAGLARAGALIEAVAQPLYVWMFGLATYGLYVVLWGAVNLVANIVDLSMTSALQRVVPTRDSDEEAHGAVRLALLVSVVPAALIALAVSLNAEAVAGLISAARARRAFGPEIRLRILWEQLARLVFAFGFFLFGFESIGLMAGHLASLALTALLAARLLGRYYRLGLILRAPAPRALAATLIGTGLALLPANLARRMLIDAPPVVLNLMLAGALGAAAAGLFEIGRKLSTVPHIVRQAFQYVLGPLSSAQAHVDRAQVAPLYRFASRVSTALVVPLAGLMIFAGPDVLSVYRDEAAAALPILVVLSAARAIEAIVGPAVTIVEMTGHRLLPLLNSALAVALWAALAWLLTPGLGAYGMALAVAAAIVAGSYAAAVELRIGDGLSPLGGRLLAGLAVALAGVGAMAAAAWLIDGVAGFAALMAIWAATSWLALRHGLSPTDHEALGGLSRRLRLV